MKDLAPHLSVLLLCQVYVNRDNLDFSTVAELPAVQEWDLLENTNGQMEYPTQ